MYQRRPRKFRRSYGGRNYQSRGNGNDQGRIGTQPFSNDLPRNNFRAIHNPEKLLEKYNALAKEALSIGDQSLSENYLQHADHFVRLIAEKNKNYQINKDKNSTEVINLDKKKEEASDGLDKKAVE